MAPNDVIYRKYDLRIASKLHLNVAIGSAHQFCDRNTKVAMPWTASLRIAILLVFSAFLNGSPTRDGCLWSVLKGCAAHKHNVAKRTCYHSLRAQNPKHVSGLHLHDAWWCKTTQTEQFFSWHTHESVCVCVFCVCTRKITGNLNRCTL